MLSDGVTGLYNRIFNVSTDEIDALKETVRTVLTFDESENVYCLTVSNNLVVASISYVKIIGSGWNRESIYTRDLKKPFVQSYSDDTLVADLAGHYLLL